MGKNLMVIAGGTWQVPIIKKAKELGYTVTNSNLYEDSIGFQYADYSAVADVKDKKTNLEIAKKYKIDGVITDQSDIAVPTVAYVAEQMGLPSIGNYYAELFTDKFMMREFCRKHGFCYPEYKLCSTKEEAIDFFNQIGKKIVIKPIDSQSSRGVYIIRDESEIVKCFEDTQQYSKDGASVLAERFIEGTEFTIDGVKTLEGHVSLCISQKGHFEYNPSIANELFFSHENDMYDYELLRETNNKLINATQLPYGLTHAEYKYENGNYYLIEMAARGGGTKIASDIVPIMSGVDNYKFLIENALGIDNNVPIEINSHYKNRCAVLKFLDINTNDKPIKAIKGVDEIRENPYVIDLGLDFSVGDILKNAKDDRSRVGYYIAYGESEQELRNLMQWIETNLKIVF